MRKLVATTMAVLMMLAVGCKVEFNTAEEMGPGDIVMQDGTILLQDFDVTTIREFIEATAEVKDYHIILNTGGGNAFNTVTMINRIQELQGQGAHITTELIGYGLSAGSVIFLMGDTRIVHEGAILMLHGAAFVQGYERINETKACDKEGLESYCDMLVMINDNFEKVLKEKTKMTDEEIHDWLHFEDANFMTAQEAYDLNIATVIIGD
jgi:ATP-dependent protease ClpP protease subunit